MIYREYRGALKCKHARFGLFLLFIHSLDLIDCRGGFFAIFLFQLQLQLSILDFAFVVIWEKGGGFK